MNRAGLRRFVEACHDGPKEMGDWSNVVLEALERVVHPAHGLALCVADVEAARSRGLAGRGRLEHLADIVNPPAAPEILGRRSIQDLYRVAWRPARVVRIRHRADAA